MGEVLYFVERTVVTVAYLAAFVVLTVTGHMTGAVEGVFGTGLGMVGTAWFAASASAQMRAVASQSQQPSPSPPPGAGIGG